MSHDEVIALLDDLVGEIQRALADLFVGAYLYGSAVTGGFNVHVSDVDLLVVTELDVDERLFGELQAMHLEFERDHPRWSDRIEVQYVSMGALSTFKTRTSRIAAISPGDPLSFKEAGADWAQNWYDVRENGVTLLGPPPAALVPAISRAEFVESIRRYAVEVAGRGAFGPRRRGAEAYDVLTMCRALYSIRTGEQVSKEAAAHWAQVESPGWSGVIEGALGIRADVSTSREACDPLVAAVMRQFVRLTAETITRRT